MKFFVDTSALVKLFVEEDGVQPMRHWMSTTDDEILVSVVTHAELLSALAGLCARNVLTQDELEALVARVYEVWKEMRVVPVTSHLIKRSGEVALKTKLKGCDSFQLTSAAGAEVSLLVGSDRQMNKAAAMLGLPVWNPTSGKRREQ